MDYSYKTTSLKLGVQTTMSCSSESYSQIVRPDGSTLRTLNPGGQQAMTVLNQRNFGDVGQSYDYFSRIAGRLEELSGTSVPHTTADFEGYMSKGLSLKLPGLSVNVRINLDDVIIGRNGEPALQRVSSHVEGASNRWGFATDLFCAVALAALFERPTTIAIYGAFAAAFDVALGLGFGNWRYAPTHAIGYLPARKIHRDEILNKPASLVEAYTERIDRLNALRKSVGNAAEIEQLQGEAAAHFQMLKELFTSAPSQKGLVVSVSGGKGSEDGLSLFEKILLGTEVSA